MPKWQVVILITLGSYYYLGSTLLYIVVTIGVEVGRGDPCSDGDLNLSVVVLGQPAGMLAT